VCSQSSNSSTPTLTEHLNEHSILSLPTEIVEKGTTLRPFMVKYHEKKRNFGLARLIREPGDMQKFVGRKFILNL
jgi:hypothetical protein